MANINVSNLYPAIYDQSETAQIYEELSEESLASVAGGGDFHFVISFEW